MIDYVAIFSTGRRKLHMMSITQSSLKFICQRNNACFCDTLTFCSRRSMQKSRRLGD